MRTKTICTIGPASNSPEVLEKLIINGMDIARFNFSHAKYNEFLQTRSEILSLSEKHKKEVKILVDLQGPRMRVGEVGESGLKLTDGQEVHFTTDTNNKDALFINDPYLHEDVKPGEPMYLANGDLELVIVKKEGSVITAKVIRGGILFSRKGVNLPETNLTTRGLTPKDIQDVEFVLENNIDYLGLSFVKDKEDVFQLREYIGGTSIGIVSKIERKQAISNLDEIIQNSDMVMVARGDLGIEIPLEELPLLQKEIIKRCNLQKKPVIVATQMLMSMVNHFRPTRAEVSDVANAVLDGADMVMLSDETAFGKYPLESLVYLVKTVEKTEEFITTF